MTTPHKILPFQNNVISIEPNLLARARSEIEQLKQEKEDFLTIYQANLQTTKQIHQFVLGLFKANGFQQSIHYILDTIAPALQLDHAFLLIESNESDYSYHHNLIPVSAQVFRDLFPDSTIRISNQTNESLPFIHFNHPVSKAYLKLQPEHFNINIALMLASDQANYFNNNQDTFLLSFLQESISAVLGFYLKQDTPNF